MVTLFNHSRWLKQGLIVTTVISALTGCSLLPKEEEGLKPPLAKPPELQIQTTEVRRGSLVVQLRGSAIFEPVEVVNYFFPTDGILKSIKIKAGDHISKGDVLFEKDLEAIELTLMEKQLEVEKLKYELSQL
jgi:multidrug efflux pump subunit AcrA (membrane-fusion protein)